MKRLPGIALGLALLLLAGGLAWLLLHDEDPQTSTPADVLRAERTATPPAAATPRSADEDVQDLAAAVPVPAATPAPVAAPMPASYRRALGALVGRVLEADGTPVPDLPIELLGGRRSTIFRSTTAWLEEGGLDLDPVVGATRTDAEGRFRLADLQPRTLGLLMLDPGGPRALLWPLEHTPVAGETRDLGDLVLPATATLAGRVLDERNAPVAGARVRATELPGIDFVPEVVHAREGGGLAVDDDGEHVVFVPPVTLSRWITRLPVPCTTTDADGRFTLPGVKPGLVTLAIDEPAHLALVQSGMPTGAAGGLRDLGTLVLGDGETVSGRVLDDAGRPVPGAELLLGTPLGVVPAAVLRGPYRADAEGRFRAPGFRPGAVWAAARASERQAFTLTTGLTAGLPCEVRLTRPRSLTLLVHAGDGVPLDDVELHLRPVPDDDFIDLLVPPREPPSVERDEQGHYVLAGLDAVQWEVLARKPGHALQRDEYDLREGDALGEIVLIAGRTLPVRVVDPTGAPIEWAQVEAIAGDDFDDPTLASARTGADGRALLRDLPLRELVVQATHPAWAVTSVPIEAPDIAPVPVPPPPELLLTLQVGARLSGQVTNAGVPPAEPLLVLLVPGDEAPTDAMLPRTTVTDAEGRFAFERVEPGEIHVEARSRENFTGGNAFWESFIESPLAEEDLEVAPGAEASVLLDIAAQYAGLETGTVAGSLLVNGLPGAGWRVRTFGRIRRSVETDARGQFDLGRLEAGELELLLAPPGTGLREGAADEVQVSLAPGERKWLELSLATASLAGRVTSAATGEPLAGARVQAVAEGEGGGWGRRAATLSGEDGRFEIDTVATGSYRLNVRADGYAAFSSAPFELRQGEHRTGLDASLTRGLRLAGSLRVDGTERAPNWMWLVATAAEGQARVTARVDRDDRSFEFDTLAAGEWTFTLATDLDNELAPVTRRVDRDEDGVELVFLPAPEEVPEAEEP